MVKSLSRIGLSAALLVCTAGSLCSFAADNLSAVPQPPITTDSGLYVKVLLASPVRMSKLKPGDAVEGSLSRDVYSADRKLFPAGSHVRLTVDHLEKRRRAPDDHWPGVVKLFTPRHEKYPVFKTAAVSLAEGERSLQVSVISVSRRREVHAKAKKDKSGQHSGTEQGAVEVGKSNAKKPATPTMVLEAFGLEGSAILAASKTEPENKDKVEKASSEAPASEAASPETSSPRPDTLPAGTQCKILLLGDVSASKSKPGDEVRARLLEPVVLNSSVVLPAGSLFEGKVVKKIPPRWLSRSGSLYLTFNELTLPDGGRFPITASLAGAELDQASHTRIDSEGRLRGERPGAMWMAINLGVTAGISKEVDDGVQLVVEAIVSTATDASTAGTARIVASCVSGLYLATRRGRDVVLPRFTEMDISLDRPVSLRLATRSETPGAVAGGK